MSIAIDPRDPPDAYLAELARQNAGRRMVVGPIPARAKLNPGSRLWKQVDPLWREYELLAIRARRYRAMADDPHRPPAERHRAAAAASRDRERQEALADRAREFEGQLADEAMLAGRASAGR